MASFFKKLIALYNLSGHVKALETEVVKETHDAALLAELKQAPLTSALISQLTGIVQEAEDDIETFSKSSFFQKFIMISSVIADEQAIQSELSDGTVQAVVNEVKNLPLLKAEVAKVSAEWRAVEGDVDTLRH